ncbi:hypothetical protein BDW02DRAFT_508327 [Decorospora gaudefroyi]|uniref:Uncharacterized protein n=1 Tax=Decorospora gaudefroyi TaxID=184978 RepID=A0A6A5K6N7_9PLEO|nr:hypothetical protein BDW02DRAFT_508327 [Decorospora gaudefroyi]
MCKGEKLLRATGLTRAAAAALIVPIDSPFTGPFVTDLNTWGYSFQTDDGTAQWRQGKSDECEFATNHNLRNMFNDLGIETRSTWQGGPNRCYFIYHKDSPAVQRPNGVTGAEFTIGVNPISGLIVMIFLQNPETSAQQLWDVPHIQKHWLPALRASSDMAYGLWTATSGHYFSSLKYILSTPITNDDTVAIFERIMQSIDFELEEMERWPGHVFYPDDEEYKALLGKFFFLSSLVFGGFGVVG